MLHIKTEIRASAVHGLGLFASEPVSAGQIVWQFTPGFDLDVHPHALEQLGPLERETLLHYGYVDSQLNRYILCCDNARFINHSDAPNIASDRSQDPLGIDRALRDIAAGEEITIDYNSFERRYSSLRRH